MLGHQAIFEVGEASSFMMPFRQKHIPQPNLLGFRLEIIDDGGVCRPSLLAFAQLGVEDGVGGDAFFLDELLDLQV